MPGLEEEEDCKAGKTDEGGLRKEAKVSKGNPSAKRSK